MDDIVRLALEHCDSETREKLAATMRLVIDKAKLDNPNSAGWRLIDKVEEEAKSLVAE